MHHVQNNRLINRYFNTDQNNSAYESFPPNRAAVGWVIFVLERVNFKKQTGKTD